jgi:integrase
MGLSNILRRRTFRVIGLRHTFGSQMAMAGADPFPIMKAMGHADFKTMMIYVSPGKSHIRDQVEKLNSISLTRQQDQRIQKCRRQKN